MLNSFFKLDILWYIATSINHEMWHLKWEESQYLAWEMWILFVYYENAPIIYIKWNDTSSFLLKIMKVF
jgi:hypothetical protein